MRIFLSWQVRNFCLNILPDYSLLERLIFFISNYFRQIGIKDSNAQAGGHSGGLFPEFGRSSDIHLAAIFLCSNTQGCFKAGFMRFVDINSGASIGKNRNATGIAINDFSVLKINICLEFA